MSRFRPISASQIARITFVLAGGMLLALVALVNSAQAGCGDYFLELPDDLVPTRKNRGVRLWKGK